MGMFPENKNFTFLFHKDTSAPIFYDTINHNNKNSVTENREYLEYLISGSSSIPGGVVKMSSIKTLYVISEE